MKIQKLLLLLTAFSIASGRGYADAITYTESDASTSVHDLSSSAAWAFYGTAANNNGVPVSGAFTTDVNAGNFSSLTGTVGQSAQSDVVSYSITGGASDSGTDQGEYISNGGGTASFSSTLFASNEVFNLYLTTYQADAVLTAKVVDLMGDTVGTFSATIPVPVNNPDPPALPTNSTDGEHGYGDIALNFSGFAPDDLVTFTYGTTAFDGGTEYNATGLSGVTANVSVPEPTTWVLFGLGALGLMTIKRLRRHV
jgi:hypothetical protein